MRRRDILAALCVASGATTRGSRAQTARRPRMGYLSGGEPILAQFNFDILIASLGDLGWRAGETIDVEARWGRGDASRIPILARELVALVPDVMVATGSSEARSLQAATRDIPIVFMQVADPVSLGIVESIARPGRNITGFAQGPHFLWGKRLDLLTELLGHPPRRLAWLGNPGNSGSAAGWADARDAAVKIGADLVRVDVSQADQLDPAFEAMKDLDALLVQFDFLFAVQRHWIAELAVRKRLPAVYENRMQAVGGGLMSYGGDLRENYRQGAAYVDRILRGARPADLPVIQASRFELVLNSGAARAIGLTIPSSLLARADEVIE